MLTAKQNARAHRFQQGTAADRDLSTKKTQTVLEMADQATQEIIAQIEEALAPIKDDINLQQNWQIFRNSIAETVMYLSTQGK